MSPEIIAAVLGLLGVLVGAVPTYFFLRQKTKAEIEKLRAETDKLKAESARIRGESQTQTADHTKRRILFVAANPIDTARLRLDEEVRGIKESLRRSTRAGLFELDQVWSVRWNDLRGHLLRHCPDVLHISGHGTDEGIVLEDESGQALVISAEALNSLLVLFSDRIRVVVINTMYSAEMCKKLAQSVRVVIGITGAVADKQASDFSAAFYEALADNQEIRVAFDFAKASLKSTNSSVESDYRLFTARRESEIYRLFEV